MTRENKNEIIEFLSNEFKTAGAIVVARYKGSTHKNLESLRLAAAESEVNVRVAKNKLVAKALENAELPALELNEENIFIWAENQIAACKVADQFAVANKETFVINTGIVEGEVADLATINAFATLPGREALLGMLAATWMAPVANFTVGLDALRKKKEEEAA